MGRAPCCDKNNVKKGPWSPEEDSQLKQYIEKYGTGGNWIALPQKVGLKRCGKSCRLRWLNYLRPNIKHGGFSEEEDRIICSLFVAIGSRWSIIAAQLPGRTDNDIKNYWNTKLKKKLLGKRCKESQTSSSSGTRRISSLSSSASAAAAKQDQKCNNSNDNIIVPPPPPPPAVEAISISPMYNNSSSSSLEMNMNMNACSSYSAIINHPALLVEQQANSSITSDHSSSSSGPSPFQVTSEEILQSLQDPCSVMQNSPRISNNPEPTFQIPPPFIYSEPSSSSDLPPLLIQSENSPLFSASRPTGPNDMTIKVEDYGFMAACSDFSFYGGGGVPEELGKNTNEIMPNHGYTEISSIFAGAVGPVFLPPADFPQQQFYPYYMSQQQDIFQDGTIFGLQ